MRFNKFMIEIRTVALIALFTCVFLSCNQDNKLEGKISKIDVNLQLDRFDQEFGTAHPEDLPKLKKEYPFLFPERYPDSVWVIKIKDTLQQELFHEVNKKYKDLDDVEVEIQQLFQHLKHYFTEFSEPRIITVISGVKYRERVILTDTIALISLDTYLGEAHKFYGGIQKYLTQNFNKNQIVPDLAHEFARKFTYQPRTKTLLEEMIYHGKLLYFKDAVIPFKSDAEKIGYTESQLQWAQENESEIWRYLVDRELLYSTDSKLPSRFINPAPFTKFYLELDAESPGRLGRYMGWQIVRAFMQKTDKDLKQMLITDAETIFRESRFKPRK